MKNIDFKNSLGMSSNFNLQYFTKVDKNTIK
jgi:hypothetical protein